VAWIWAFRNSQTVVFFLLSDMMEIIKIKIFRKVARIFF